MTHTNREKATNQHLSNLSKAAGEVPSQQKKSNKTNPFLTALYSPPAIDS